MTLLPTTLLPLVKRALSSYSVHVVLLKSTLDVAQPLTDIKSKKMTYLRTILCAVGLVIGALSPPAALSQFDWLEERGHELLEPNIEQDRKVIDHSAEMRDHLSSENISEEKCSYISESNGQNCLWVTPSRIPFSRALVLSNVEDGRAPFTVTDLGSRMGIPAPPETPMSDQPWWERALAEAEERGLGSEFTESERFQNLPTERQQALSNEAQRVYDYCTGRTIYSNLHDCSCVAQKFVPARLDLLEMEPPDFNCAKDDRSCKSREMIESRILKNQKNSNKTNTLLNIAMDAVNALDIDDQCPNAAGVVAYGYRQCMNLYHAQYARQEDLESYCGCYGEVLSTIYINNPNTHTQALIRYGVAARSECRDQGFPAPGEQ